MSLKCEQDAIIKGPLKKKNPQKYLQPTKPTVLFSFGGPSMQWLQTAASSVVYAAYCLYRFPYGTLATSLSSGHSYLIACCPKSRLQTSSVVCSVFGKPQGTVARVHIGQVIMSICTKLHNKEHVIKDLCKAKFKSAGHQKIHSSKKRGFTKCNVNEFENMMAAKQFISDGSGVK